MVSNFEIGNIRIGIDEDPLVIPEIGINHESWSFLSKQF